MQGKTGKGNVAERDEWYARLAELAEDGGSFEQLGRRHSALFVEDGPTLLVTFEMARPLRSSADQLPLGTLLAEESGWSHLALLSEANDWFRDPKVYGYFDRLVDDGFFEEFDRIVFYGAGPCGYAAAAFSVAAPGATVIALAPQATLDPRVTEWDPRFAKHRRLSFTDRYGYAPDMLEAADHAYVLYDPLSDLDAMHAALFTRPNVSKLRCRYLDGSIESDLIKMGVLGDLIDAACEGKLEEQVFHRLFRARRDNPLYLRRLLARLDQDARLYLVALLCRNVSERIRAPRFRKRLASVKEELAAQGRALPWSADEDTDKAE